MIFAMINFAALAEAARTYQDAKPFKHFVVDGLLDFSWALALSGDFPDLDSPDWHRYQNPIENKLALSDWNKISARPYKTLSILNSPEFTALLSKLTGVSPLYADPGLNGGGLHVHGQGGKLNPHLDYSLHPKTGLQRRVNLLWYGTPGYRREWGGRLGLYGNASADAPGPLTKVIDPVFNRAVIFDTTQNSWHGLVDPWKSEAPRQSLAVYYLTKPAESADTRSRALFAPDEGQQGDPEVAALCERRSRAA